MATQSSAKPDYLIKLMIIGNSCSGKGKLMYQFAQVNHPIQPVHSAMATLVLDSADFQIRQVEIGGARCKVQIWNNADSGHPSRTFCRGVMGIVFAYSVTDAESFASIPNW